MTLEQEILEILKKNPEELKHAKDTLKWLLIIKPDSDSNLRIAALSHDIERAIEPWKIKDYKLDKEFRAKHTQRSAEAIKEILEKNNFDEKDIKIIYSLVLNHEFGGNESKNILKDADSLANFEWCDDLFGIEKIENLKSVAEKMFSRLSEENKKYIKDINFKNKEIKEIISQL